MIGKQVRYLEYYCHVDIFGCRYFYDVREWYDPDTVIARAAEMLGSGVDRLPYKDPQHFASWCRTGTLQLHC